MSDEFYIGWEPRAPRDTARFVRRWVLVLGIGMVGAVGFVAVRQAEFSPATFMYGYDTVVTGRVVARPVPRIRTPDGGDQLLVGEGKHGAHRQVADLDGVTASVTGSPIRRGRHRALEVHAIGGRREPGAPPPPPEALGTVTLRGEVVDGKCWLGVMNPGDGKVHRGCAARCISGGAPPLFVTRDAVLLLIVPDTRALLPFVAEPVTITGELQRDGQWLVIRTVPAAIHRL